MENSVLAIFVIMFSMILYILWNVLKFIMDPSSFRSQEAYSINVNNNNQNEEEPYEFSGRFENCPICTDRIRYKVELNCTHCFCGKCIMEYYDSIRPNKLLCPLCRSDVRIINNENIIRNENTREFYDKIVWYNNRLLHPGFYSYMEYIIDFSYIFYRGIATIFSDGLSIFYFIVFITMLILYVISPFDIIPDVLGIIGFLDDIMFIFVFIFWVMNSFYSMFLRRTQEDVRIIEAQ